VYDLGLKKKLFDLIILIHPTSQYYFQHFNDSIEEKSKYLFQFSEKGKRGKRTSHSFFIDLTSPKKGKTRGFSYLRARNGPKKQVIILLS